MSIRDTVKEISNNAPRTSKDIVNDIREKVAEYNAFLKADKILVAATSTPEYEELQNKLIDIKKALWDIGADNAHPNDAFYCGKNGMGPIDTNIRNMIQERYNISSSMDSLIKVEAAKRSKEAEGLRKEIKDLVKELSDSSGALTSRSCGFDEVSPNEISPSHPTEIIYIEDGQANSLYMNNKYNTIEFMSEQMSRDDIVKAWFRTNEPSAESFDKLNNFFKDNELKKEKEPEIE